MFCAPRFPSSIVLHLDHSLTLGEYLGRVLLFLLGFATLGVLLLVGVRAIAMLHVRVTTDRRSTENDP